MWKIVATSQHVKKPPKPFARLKLCFENKNTAPQTQLHFDSYSLRWICGHLFTWTQTYTHNKHKQRKIHSTSSCFSIDIYTFFIYRKSWELCSTLRRSVCPYYTYLSGIRARNYDNKSFKKRCQTNYVRNLWQKKRKETRENCKLKTNVVRRQINCARSIKTDISVDGKRSQWRQTELQKNCCYFKRTERCATLRIKNVFTWYVCIKFHVYNLYIYTI